MSKASTARKAGGQGKAIVGYRLGLYDPDPEKGNRVRFIGRCYGCDREERLLLRETIAEFNELAARSPRFLLCLAAYPVYPESDSGS